MCTAVDGCDREPVVLVDVTFPVDVTIDPSVDDGVDRPQPIGTQRVGYCIRHAIDAGLEDAGPLVDATAVRGLRAKGRLPDGHALVADYSWKVT